MYTVLSPYILQVRPQMHFNQLRGVENDSRGEPAKNRGIYNIYINLFGCSFNSKKRYNISVGPEAKA
jgi:hypothetical protein